MLEYCLTLESILTPQEHGTVLSIRFEEGGYLGKAPAGE